MMEGKSVFWIILYDSLLKWITSLLRVETETWNFVNGANSIIEPTLSSGSYAVKIGLYLVPIDFCSEQ